MSHKPIFLKALGLSFPHKICFEAFTATIYPGSRIALMGRNGNGKSSLLKMIHGTVEPTEGSITRPEDLSIGYVPQIVTDFDSLSGGQRINEALTQALALKPDILLLDEPTNHLDHSNKKSLMRMLRNYQETLIIVSHDEELLRSCVDTLWHIENQAITVFSGNYDAYLAEIEHKRTSITQELAHLNRAKKETHASLMTEQKRAQKQKVLGEKNRAQKKWAPVTAGGKERQAEQTTGKNVRDIRNKKQDLVDQLNTLYIPEVLTPHFSFTAHDISSKNIVSIADGSVGYATPLLQNIFFSLNGNNRIALMGANGTGKSTFVKALLDDPHINRSGEWHIIKKTDIGYLDQHYSTLNPQSSVFETIHTLVPEWPQEAVRKHLNDFLFRKNEEVNALVATLSGGEKARLSCAQIAAKTPKLLLLDEISNNVDLETRNHLIQVLKAFPGALIVISHDKYFLKEIGIEHYYVAQNQTLKMQN